MLLLLLLLLLLQAGARVTGASSALNDKALAARRMGNTVLIRLRRAVGAVGIAAAAAAAIKLDPLALARDAVALARAHGRRGQRNVAKCRRGAGRIAARARRQQRAGRRRRARTVRDDVVVVVIV